jgi:ATP-dependent DNA ligase
MKLFILWLSGTSRVFSSTQSATQYRRRFNTTTHQASVFPRTASYVVSHTTTWGMSPHRVRKRIQTTFIEPMQCKPVAALPAGEKWAFELKLDGYRCIAVKRGKEVTLFSRHRKVLNRPLPGVVDAPRIA